MKGFETSAVPAQLSATHDVVSSPYRWVVLAFAWGALVLTFVDRLAWGNLAVPVGQSLALPVGALGVFVTAFYIGYVLANVLGGIASDVLGPRRTLAISLLPLGLCTFLFGQIHSVAAGLAIQVLMGLAAGCDYAACVKLTTAWFGRAQRGRAMGLLMTATSLAVVLANAILPKWLQTTGWQQIYAQLGMLTAGFGVVCWVVLRDGPNTGRNTGRNTGLNTGLNAGSNRGAARLDLGALVRNRDLLLLAVAGFGAMWGTWGFTFWANALMIKGYGLSPVVAGGITMMFGIGAIVSKPLIGLLSDWMGGRRKTLVVVCFAAFAVLLLVFGQQSDVERLRWVAPLLGVAAFAYSPLMAAMIAEVAGPRLAGSATGATNAFWQLGSVTVPLAVGAAFQSTHSFFVAFVALSVGPALAVLAMLPVKEAGRGR